MDIDKPVLRVIDVNLNRVKEGLRVCEDITRFILNDPASTRALKSLRHRIQDIVVSSSMDNKLLCMARNTKDDFGTDFSRLEDKDRWQAVFFANMQRAKEALRVLEEFSKLFKANLSGRFKGLRFHLYDQEKRLIGKYF
jgi:hypothetical protein